MEIPIHTPIQQYINKMKLWRFTQNTVSLQSF
jgi:hypothetical protein